MSDSSSPKSTLDLNKAWSYVLRLLSQRAYTQKQLRDKLMRRGYDEALIEQVLAKLVAYQLVDDAAYAEAFIRSHRHQKGGHALARALRDKGVAEQEISRALVQEAGDEVAHAHRVLQKHAWRFNGNPATKKRKAYMFLARRGFDTDTIYEVLLDGYE